MIDKIASKELPKTKTEGLPRNVPANLVISHENRLRGEEMGRIAGPEAIATAELASELFRLYQNYTHTRRAFPHTFAHEPLESNEILLGSAVAKAFRSYIEAIAGKALPEQLSADTENTANPEYTNFEIARKIIAGEVIDISKLPSEDFLNRIDRVVLYMALFGKFHDHLQERLDKLKALYQLIEDFKKQLPHFR